LSVTANGHVVETANVPEKEKEEIRPLSDYPVGDRPTLVNAAGEVMVTVEEVESALEWQHREVTTRAKEVLAIEGPSEDQQKPLTQLIFDRSRAPITIPDDAKAEVEVVEMEKAKTKPKKPKQPKQSKREKGGENGGENGEKKKKKRPREEDEDESQRFPYKKAKLATSAKNAKLRK